MEAGHSSPPVFGSAGAQSAAVRWQVPSGHLIGVVAGHSSPPVFGSAGAQSAAVRWQVPSAHLIGVVAGHSSPPVFGSVVSGGVGEAVGFFPLPRPERPADWVIFPEDMS